MDIIILLRSSFYVLLSCTSIAASVDVSLTVDVSSDDVLLCPEVVTFTCVAINLEVSVLRWFHDEEIPIIDLNYVYNAGDDYPFMLEDIQSPGFLNLTIRNATFDGDSGFLNFMADLLVDMEVIFDLGYRSLQCGSLTENRNFAFSKLDIEAPPTHEIVYVGLLYSTSSTFFKHLDVWSVRKLSNDNCQYRNNTKINVTFSLNDVPQDSTISRETCSISHCLISVPQPSVADLLTFTAVNKFAETPFTPPHVNILVPSAVPANFNLSLTYTDECSTLVECSILQGLPISTCSLRYGTDPSYSEESQVSREVPTNTPISLDGLEDSTLYYVEAVFTVDDGTEVNYHWRTTYRTEENVCRRLQQLTNIVVPVTMAAVMMASLLVCVIIIIFLIGKVRSQSKTLKQLEEKYVTKEKSGSNLPSSNPTYSSLDPRSIPLADHIYEQAADQQFNRPSAENAECPAATSNSQHYMDLDPHTRDADKSLYCNTNLQ